MRPWSPDDLPAQLAGRITVSPSGCWIVHAHLDRDGYAQVWYAGGSRRAHRVAYQHLVGPIADGFTLDHVWELGCRSKACCRPDHLEPVTIAENVRRYWARRRRLRRLDEAWDALANLSREPHETVTRAA